MTTKNLAYDHAAYIARSMFALGQNAAGAGNATQFTRFAAFTALQIFSLTATLVTAGTSTSTLWNGTATVTNINGDSLSLIRIFNTAAAGAAPALATATWGPYAVSLYNGTATGTQTNAAGVTVNIPLFATTTNGTGQQQVGTNSGVGGFQVNQGDQLYVIRGTDATAVTAVSLEYGIQPLANVTV
jgi:hypothetical protein